MMQRYCCSSSAISQFSLARPCSPRCPSKPSCSAYPRKRVEGGSGSSSGRIHYSMCFTHSASFSLLITLLAVWGNHCCSVYQVSWQEYALLLLCMSSTTENHSGSIICFHKAAAYAAKYGLREELGNYKSTNSSNSK